MAVVGVFRGTQIEFQPFRTWILTLPRVCQWHNLVHLPPMQQSQHRLILPRIGLSVLCFPICATSPPCRAFDAVASFENCACTDTGKDIKYSPEDAAFCSNIGYGYQAWGYLQNTGVMTGLAVVPATAKIGVPTNFVPRALTVCEVYHKLCKSWPPLAQCLSQSLSIWISQHTDKPQQGFLVAMQ